MEKNFLISGVSGQDGSYLARLALSNGFKVRTNGSDYNADGSEYIYMAFAAEPLVGTNNIPSTAK